MAELNIAMLRAVVLAFRTHATSAIEVGNPGERRMLFFEAGCLVGSLSEAPGDRLGDQLVAEGRLDAERLATVASAARLAGRPLGNQLIAEGVVAPHELAAALERQAALRFAQALTRAGPVSDLTRAPPPAVGRTPLGALVIDVFRGCDFAVVDLVASRIALAKARLAVPPDDLEQLKLKPFEVRIARMFAHGHAPDLPNAEPQRSNAMRVVAGLGALGLLIQGQG